MEIPESLAPIILASASPRRRDILRGLGIEFTIRPSGLEEPFLPLPGGFAPPGPDPAAHAREWAARKAHEAAGTAEAGTVIGSDTVVAVGARAIGKPRTAEEARRILSFLSGKEQRVISGLCLIHVPTGIEVSGTDATRVFTRPMSAGEIDEYVRTGECFGKAGAYAIQESGDRFIERIEGSRDTVVGFPTELFGNLLGELASRVEAEGGRE